jgi:hypothetical protein
VVEVLWMPFGGSMLNFRTQREDKGGGGVIEGSWVDGSVLGLATESCEDAIFSSIAKELHEKLYIFSKSWLKISTLVGSFKEKWL